MRVPGWRGVEGVTLLAALFLATLVLWVGLPLAWLWIGSQVQAATESVGAAIGTMMVGFVVSLALLLPCLGVLTRAYQRTRVARGLPDTGAFPLEVVLVLSAMLALAGLVVWFVGFSGSSPLPIQISY